jgi:O-antigen/teichoic acid export membrane protein
MTSAVGFVFWLVNSRLYTTEQIGLATTLVSGASVIAVASLLGFNTWFVRFLPASRRQNEEINTGLAIVFAAALLAATLYVLFVPLAVPRLVFMRNSLVFASGFAVLTALWAVNIVTDSVFIAFRNAQYNVLADGIIQGAVKLALPVLFVGLGAYGMFLASGLAAAAAAVASVVFMVRTVAYEPKPCVSLAVLGRAWQFSAANYAANLLSLCPVLVIPLIVLNARGAREAGFYFIAFQVANLLYTVGYAVASSFLAESSYEGAHLPSLLRHATRVLIIVLAPSSLIIALTGTWVLLMFGTAYSVNGASTLAILALSAPSVALYTTAMTVLRVTKQLRAIVAAGAFYAVAVLGLVTLGAPHSLQWVASAWLIGNSVAGLFAAGFAAVHLRRSPVAFG